MMTSSPGDTAASTACQIDCFAPLDTTTSLAWYSSPFSSGAQGGGRGGARW